MKYVTCVGKMWISISIYICILHVGTSAVRTSAFYHALRFEGIRASHCVSTGKMHLCVHVATFLKQNF